MKSIILVLVVSWILTPLKSIAHEVIRKVGEAPHPIIHPLSDEPKLMLLIGISIFLIVLTLAIRFDGPGEMGGPGGF